MAGLKKENIELRQHQQASKRSVDKKTAMTCWGCQKEGHQRKDCKTHPWPTTEPKKDRGGKRGQPIAVKSGADCDKGKPVKMEMPNWIGVSARPATVRQDSGVGKQCLGNTQVIPAGRRHSKIDLTFRRASSMGDPLQWWGPLLKKRE